MKKQNVLTLIHLNNFPISSSLLAPDLTVYFVKVEILAILSATVKHTAHCLIQNRSSINICCINKMVIKENSCDYIKQSFTEKEEGKKTIFINIFMN